MANRGIIALETQTSNRIESPRRCALLRPVLFIKQWDKCQWVFSSSRFESFQRAHIFSASFSFFFSNRQTCEINDFQRLGCRDS